MKTAGHEPGLMSNVSGTRASTMYAGVMREGALGKDT